MASESYKGLLGDYRRARGCQPRRCREGREGEEIGGYGEGRGGEEMSWRRVEGGGEAMDRSRPAFKEFVFIIKTLRRSQWKNSVVL